VLHFNAISTDQLSPEVARAYNIVRSKNRALLNVSIIKDVDGGPGVSQAGTVTATAANLTGQIKNLALREIREDAAIYYKMERNGYRFDFPDSFLLINRINPDLVLQSL